MSTVDARLFFSVSMTIILHSLLLDEVKARARAMHFLSGLSKPLIAFG